MASDLLRGPLREHVTAEGRAKKGFDTQEEAAEHAAMRQAQRGSRRRPYHAYRCGMCGRWHVGRRPAR